MVFAFFVEAVICSFMLPRLRRTLLHFIFIHPGQRIIQIKPAVILRLVPI